jgi:hypothetical protein
MAILLNYKERKQMILFLKFHFQYNQWSSHSKYKTHLYGLFHYQGFKFQPP